MPAPQRKMTRAQRQDAEDDLSRYLSKALTGDWYGLRQVIDAMRTLGLHSYGGVSLEELIRFREYRNRVFYERRLKVQLRDVGHRFGPRGLKGGAMPVLPTDPEFRLQLESLDRKRRLIAALQCSTDYRRPVYLTTEALHLSLGGLGRAEVTLETDSRRRNLAIEPSVRDAYASGGLPSVWNQLDRTWIDQLLVRPLKTPLTDLSVRIRCRALAGRTVRVVTPSGPLVGALGDIEYGVEPITAVPLIVEGARVDVPTTGILELVPHVDAYEREDA